MHAFRNILCGINDLQQIEIFCEKLAILLLYNEKKPIKHFFPKKFSNLWRIGCAKV
ncbi:hypothetical protein CCP2SC5_190009 [Azospirillaceae bacterium]